MTRTTVDPHGRCLPCVCALLVLVVSLGGCDSDAPTERPVDQPDADDTVPNFGAVDNSKSCPTGQIGWDFGTGWGRVGPDGGAHRRSVCSGT